jgi:hypothetical protein
MRIDEEKEKHKPESSAKIIQIRGVFQLGILIGHSGNFITEFLLYMKTVC